MQARLVLENGNIFYGKSFGAEGTSKGEVVFNTAMTGYQELLTDPSYYGQIVNMTYPLVGNYGINLDDFESNNIYVRGFIVREACTHPSNWRSRKTLAEFLQHNSIVGLYGVDTRALTRVIRQSGTLRGIITSQDYSDAELLKMAHEVHLPPGETILREVSTPEKYILPGQGFRVVLLDFGLKQGIARFLNQSGCEVIIVPAFTTYEEIIALKPQGVLLSNGPGDPKDTGEIVNTVRKLVSKFPVFGICLGHQILGLALGGDTYKLKFGHRGANHPVKDLQTGKVQITSQNHGYAIDDTTLEGTEITITHRNLNDGTVEGLSHNKYPAFSVQYHPEASPGPIDSIHLFDRFFKLMEINQQAHLL